MPILVDVHCHLLAALDDGPRTPEEALAMCRIAYAEGTQMIAATAHQNETWHQVTPQRIRTAAQQLAELLQLSGLPLTVFPSAEVMAYPEMEDAWTQGELLSVADRRRYLLVEMPHRVFLDLRHVAEQLGQLGLRIILAHPERHAEFLHDPGRIEEMIEGGCLVQVSAASVTQPRSAEDERALKSWFKRGCVHLIGSDGHSPTNRPPRLADAYRQISRWTGTGMADRICSSNGLAVLQGMSLRVPRPQPKRTWWVPRFW